MDDIELLIPQWSNDLSSRGILFHRKVECITLRRDVGMRSGQVPHVFLLTVVVHGGGASEAIEQLHRLVGRGGDVAAAGR